MNQEPLTQSIQDYLKHIFELTEQGTTANTNDLAERMGVKPTDLERDLAALRHMEKIRAELRDGKRFITLW